MNSQFTVGDCVRVRHSPLVDSKNPRTPYYARGHIGVIVREHGVIVNPLDHHLPYPPMYTVKFDGRELWGEKATHHVFAEFHEEWLEACGDAGNE